MTSAADLTRTVELRTAATPPCPRCAAPALLVARYPHTWPDRAGHPVDGLKETLLCGSCDAADPAAGRLLALFAEDGRPDAARLTAFGELVHVWLDTVRARVPDSGEPATEEARWRAGDL